MRIEFRLPSLGADMESATLTEWLKQPGDRFAHGEPIVTVETTKGLIDVEAYQDGQIADLVVAPGTKVPVGAVLAHLTVADSDQTAAPASSGAGLAPPQATEAGEPIASAGPVEAPPAPTSTVTATPPPATGRARLSPAARRRAEELGLSPASLEQAGPATILHVADVERLAAARSAAAGGSAAPADPRAAMRVAIGAAMARAKREIPHYYLGLDVDYGAARDWLARTNARVPVQERLIDAVLITKAIALAAARIDGFNGAFRDGRFEPAHAVHAGVAIALRGGGLVAPALLDADRKDLPALMRDFSALVTRVRAGRMRSGEFSAATITVTSLGAEGADVLYPIINPPQVAIVGAGAIREQPAVRDGQIAIRPILTLALAADHRVTDGRAGSRFLRAIADLLQHPDEL